MATTLCTLCTSQSQARIAECCCNQWPKARGGGVRTASELTIDLISLTVSCLSWKEVECQNCWVWCKARTHAGEWVAISMWYCYAVEKSCSLDRTSPLSLFSNLHIPWQQQQRHFAFWVQESRSEINLVCWCGCLWVVDETIVLNILQFGIIIFVCITVFSVLSFVAH